MLTGSRCRKSSGSLAGVGFRFLQNLFRRSSLLPQAPKAGGIVTLRHPRTRGIPDEIAVIVAGRLVSEGSKNQKLASGRFQKIGAANDFRDLHQSIVHGYGELIGRHVVPPPYDEVPKILRCDKALRTEVQVGESDGFAIRHS